MEELLALHISQLRERAARCRELALRATSGDVADGLMELATDYKVDARRLEHEASTAGLASRASGT